MEMEKSYDCQNASELTLKNMGKIDWQQTITLYNKSQIILRFERPGEE